MNEAHSIESLSAEAFGWYFTGLTDGEGCFGFARRNLRTRGTWTAVFTIGMRDDETPNLQAIMRRMGCGHMYLDKASRTIANAKPKIVWRVERARDNAEVIVPHFERFPLQFKKARDFAIWKQAVPLLLEVSQRTRAGKPREHRRITDSEIAFVTGLRDQLRAIREYAPPGTGADLAPPPALHSADRLLPGFE